MNMSNLDVHKKLAYFASIRNTIWPARDKTNSGLTDKEHSAIWSETFLPKVYRKVVLSFKSDTCMCITWKLLIWLKFEKFGHQWEIETKNVYCWGTDIFWPFELCCIHYVNTTSYTTVPKVINFLCITLWLVIQYIKIMVTKIKCMI